MMTIKHMQSVRKRKGMFSRSKTPQVKTWVTVKDDMNERLLKWFLNFFLLKDNCLIEFYCFLSKLNMSQPWYLYDYFISKVISQVNKKGEISGVVSAFCILTIKKSKCKSLSVSDACNPNDCIIHGILKARILEWVAFPFSRGSSLPRDWT